MSETLKAFNHVMDVAEKLGLLERIKMLFAAKRTVLVLGTSGVGKTCLLKSLNLMLPEAIHYLNRTRIAQKYKMDFSRARIDFIDTPGEENHHSRRSIAVRESMKEKHLGIINVVSYGYHEHATGISSAFDKKGDVSEEYLKHHRNIEISSLSEWENLLGDEKTSDFFMTVITKADIWWDKREEVLSYYQNGIYSQHLGNYSKLNPLVLEYCSVIQRFYGKGKISSTFDDSVRKTLRLSLISTILGATR